MAHLKYAAATLPLLFALALCVINSSWGLPTEEKSKFLFQGEGDREVWLKEIKSASGKDITQRDSFVRSADEDEEAQALAAEERILRRFLLYTEHPDEMLTLAAFAGMSPRKLDIRPRNYQYGGAYLYPAGVFVILWRTLNSYPAKPDLESMLRNADEIAVSYQALRLFNIVALLFIFLGGYLILRAAELPQAYSLLGGSLICLMPGVTAWAALAKPHLLGCGLMLTGIGIAFQIPTRKSFSPKRWYSAMFVVGLATGAQYFMAFLIPVCIFLMMIIQRKEKEQVIAKRLLMGGLVAVTAFLASNPTIPFNLNSFYADVCQVSSHYRSGNYLTQGIIYLPRLFFTSAGSMVIFLALASITRKIKLSTSTKIEVLVLLGGMVWFSLIVVILLSTESQRLQQIRFLLPAHIFIMLSLLILAGHTRKYIWQKIALALTLATGIYGSTMVTLTYMQTTDTTNSRLRAARYIAEKIPPDEKILVNGDPAPYTAPLFSVRHRPEKWESTRKYKQPCFLISTSQLDLPTRKWELIENWQPRHTYNGLTFGEQNFWLYRLTEK